MNANTEHHMNISIHENDDLWISQITRLLLMFHYLSSSILMIVRDSRNKKNPFLLPSFATIFASSSKSCFLWQTKLNLLKTIVCITNNIFLYLFYTYIHRYISRYKRCEIDAKIGRTFQIEVPFCWCAHTRIFSSPDNIQVKYYHFLFLYILKHKMRQRKKEKKKQITNRL